MINIAFVDDDKNTCDLFSVKIRNMIANKPNVHVFDFSSGISLLTEIKKGIRFAIVISDVEMPDMDGLELGKRIKEFFPTTYLIFLTSYPQFAMNSYLLNAHQYVMKEDMDERLPEILLDVVEKLEKEQDEILVLGSMADICKVYCSDILYFQKDKESKYVEYVTATNRIRDRKSMEQAVKEMRCRDFIQIERRYMVNMQHITRVKGDTITLSNGEQLPVSRRKITYVKEQMNRYWGALC